MRGRTLALGAAAVVVLVAGCGGDAREAPVTAGPGTEAAGLDLSCADGDRMDSVTELAADATGLPATPELALVESLEVEATPLAAAVPADIPVSPLTDGATGFTEVAEDDGVLFVYRKQGAVKGLFFVQRLNDGWVSPRFSVCLDALHPEP
ncbi:MAG TPA: hypothetical protein VGB14_12260 [Acidimicrobiales bacterium]|jgi:hypothetical protein